MPSTFRELEAILALDGKLKDCQNELKDCRDELEDSRNKFKSPQRGGGEETCQQQNGNPDPSQRQRDSQGRENAA